MRFILLINYTLCIHQFYFTFSSYHFIQSCDLSKIKETRKIVYEKRKKIKELAKGTDKHWQLRVWYFFNNIEHVEFILPTRLFNTISHNSFDTLFLLLANLRNQFNSNINGLQCRMLYFNRVLVSSYIFYQFASWKHSKNKFSFASLCPINNKIYENCKTQLE